jgi:hypothetical protein
MNHPDRGVCPRTSKARFTHAEALDKVRVAKLRGDALAAYRCPDAQCGGYWHTAHATDHEGRGGGVRRTKSRKPSRRVARAKKLR